MSKIVLDKRDINGLAGIYVKGLSFEGGKLKMNNLEICNLSLNTSVNVKDLSIIIKNVQLNAEDISIDFNVNRKAD